MVGGAMVGGAMVGGAMVVASIFVSAAATKKATKSTENRHGFETDEKKLVKMSGFPILCGSN